MNAFDEDYYSVMRSNVDDEDMDTIPLLEGINLQHLTDPNRGAEFEVDPSNTQYASELPTYHSEDIHKHLNSEVLGDQGESEDEDEEGKRNEADESPFEKIGKQMVNLTEDGGVKKRILSEGVGGPAPLNMEIKCHYTGLLEYADEPFDSTRLRAKPLQYLLGCGEMIEGLELGLATMRKREEAEFLIQPKYAFGARGIPPRIPKDSSLLFQVELIDWQETTEIHKFFKMSHEERRTCDIALIKKVANSCLDEGLACYKQLRYVGATKHYTRGIRAIDNYHPADEETERDYKKLMIRLNQNACIAHMKLNNFNAAKRFADQALQIDPKNAKVLFNLGKAQGKCGDFDQAIRTLKEALKCSPKNKDITEELSRLNKYKAALDFEHMDMCRRMFGTNLTKGKGKENGARAANNNDEYSEVQVNDSFRKMIESRVKAFAQTDVMEMSLPLQKFTVAEKQCIAEICTQLGLEYLEKGEGSNLHIRLCKKRVSP